MFELNDNSSEAKAIFAFTDQGDEAIEKNNFNSAIEFYKKAWGAIPEPKKEWDLAHWVMSCIGGGYYEKKDYEHAIEYFQQALTCYRGDVDSEINFSLGQAYYDKGDTEKATAFLQKAWNLSEGRAFEDEDPKYLSFLQNNP